MLHLGPSHRPHVPLPVDAVVQNLHNVPSGEGEGCVGRGGERGWMVVLLYMVLSGEEGRREGGRREGGSEGEGWREEEREKIL